MTTEKGSVAVVGCGWLGFALARHLLATGYRVYGSTTTPDKLPALREAGIAAAALELPLAGAPDDVLGDLLWTADQLVLNVPPGRGADTARTYPAAVLSAVLHYRRRQPSGRIILCSSTGVYGDARGTVDEATPITGTTARVRALAMAEYQVQTQSQRPYAILRLAGLYGGDRHPGRHLAGRRDIADGDAPVNLASRARVIAAITEWLDRPFWTGAVCNVVDPEHPSRRELYTAYARQHGLAEPSFLPGGHDHKRVVSRCATP